MRAVVQRVASAAVTVRAGEEDVVVGRIDRGLLVFVGVERDDGDADVRYIAGKIAEVRVFEDPAGRMNRSVRDAGGAVLVVSQFTLSADCRTGRRPSFDAAAPAERARPLYEKVVAELRGAGLQVETGRFQAMMQVALLNDGPVTILLDSGKRF